MACAGSTPKLLVCGDPEVGNVVVTGERKEKRPPTVHLPYITGVSEHIRRVCRAVSKDTCIKGFSDKSAIAEHAWMEDHPISWDDTRILQHAN